MNKEQFKKLKVGDVVEYNSRNILVGCQFKITKLFNTSVEGVVTKQADGGNMLGTFLVGKSISGTKENLTLVNAESVANEPFAMLALSVQEAAVLFRLLRSVAGNEQASIRKFAGSISAKLHNKFPIENCFDLVKMFKFNDNCIRANISKEELDEKLVEVGLLKAPEKSKAAARHKTKGPDGKFAPKNYRRVMYPERGNGKLIERHILLGDFVNGTSGTNVSVQEWDGKEWQPKTYSAAKIKPAAE